MSELINGWASIQLHEICVLLNGRAYKQEELLQKGKYAVLRVGNFFSNKNWYYSDLELEESKYCYSGDLLYAWSASFGPKIWEGAKTIYHYHIWRAQLDERFIDKKFLYYWFEWDKHNIKSEHGTGSTMIHITKGDMEGRRLAIPSLKEQQRIAAKIGRLSARSDGARQALKRAHQLVLKYRRAFLDAAYTGSLRRSREFASHPWTEVEVGSIITTIRAGKNLRCEERPPRTDEKGIVKVSAVTWGTFKPDQSKTLPPNYDPLERDRILPGDFLFSRANTLELVGACVLVEHAPDNLYLSDKILRLEMNDGIKPWLLWFLRSTEGRRQLEKVSSGNQLSMRNISQEGLRGIRIPMPSRDERDDIIQCIESSFTAIDRLAAEAHSARDALDKLDQAILAKAFRGELVPQDPDDETASVLLDRIRTERTAAEPIPKRTRRPRSAAGA